LNDFPYKNMRTKTLLCAAALAAGVATSMAQSNVYSLNVVGYCNVPYKGGGLFQFICNPLNNTNNNITNLFVNPPDNTSIIRWDPIILDLEPNTYSYSTFLHKWQKNGADGNFVLKPGEGVFLISDGASPDFTNTFVGEVIQGPYTNHLIGGSTYNAVGSSVPLGGSFSNSIVQLAQVDNDTVQPWDVNIQDLAGNAPNWSQFLHTWSPNNVNLAVGEGFFYVRQDPAVDWVRNFTVQ